MKFSKLVETKFGRMMIPASDAHVGESLERDGLYSKDELNKLLALIGPNDNVLELGAHIGSFTVPLAQKCKHVWAFEPQPITRAYLSANMLLNDLNNVTIRHEAISDRLQTVEAATYQLGTENFNTGGMVFGPGQNAQRAYMVTLDSLNFSEPIKLVKMDIEGYEPQALLGGLNFFRTHKPVLWMEHDRPENMPATEMLLSKLGYEFELHTDRLNSFSDYCAYNILCWPKK